MNVRRSNPDCSHWKKLCAIVCFVGLASSLFAVTTGSLTLIKPASAAITITPPTDKTVTATGTSTIVDLGNPAISGTADSSPTISNDASGSSQGPSGAVAYWSFNNSFDDESGNGNTGAPKGDASITKTAIGNVLSLDGTGDYVTVGDSSTLRIAGAFSISVWVKLDTTVPAGDYVRILEKGSSPGDKYWMYYVKSTKRIGFGFVNGQNNVAILTSKTDWLAGKWYHIVGTYDPAAQNVNNIKIYVNGVLDNQEIKSGNPIVNYDPLKIGTESNASWNFWQGDLDEMRIYKRALTASETATLYKSSYTTVTLPLGTNVITWKVTDNTGSSATAIQVVNVTGSNTKAPITSLDINGKKYVNSASGNTFVKSATAFDLSVQSPTTIKGTYYRYFKASDLIRPSFSSGTYFKIDGDNVKYSVQFYSVTSNGNSESLNQNDVFLDNLPPATSLSVVDSTAGKIRLTATDNTGGAGIAGSSDSGIYYKIDSATSYIFVKSKTVDLTNIANGAHTIYYYSTDNVGNQGVAKSTKFDPVSIVTYTFCSSGCTYNSLQAAITALPAGGKVYVKDGSYTLSKTINLKSNMILEFSSGSSIFFTGDGITLFKGSSVSNVQIMGGDVTAKLAGVDGFAFYSSKDIQVTGTKLQLIKGSGSSGLYCNNCIGVSISNVDFSSASRLIDIKEGAKITDGKSSDIWIQNSRFEDSTVECVKVNYSTHVHIIGNDVSDCADNGIDIGSNHDTEVRDNTITRTGMPNGVAIHSDNADYATLTNNYIDTTGKGGISVYRASHIDVIGNTLTKIASNGIDVTPSTDPSSYIMLKSNRIITPGGIGIYVSPNQNQVEISSNTLDILVDHKAIFVVSPNPTTTLLGNIII